MESPANLSPTPMDSTHDHMEQGSEIEPLSRSDNAPRVSIDASSSTPSPLPPQIDQAGKMTGSPPRSSRELSAAAVSWTLTVSHEEKTAKDLDAKIEALLKEKEEARVRAEEGRRQAKLNEQAAKQRLFMEQCAERHGHFKSSFTDHAMREMKEAVAADVTKSQAIQSIVHGTGGDLEYQIFKCTLAEVCMGEDIDFVRDVATRVLNHTSEQDERVLQTFKPYCSASAGTRTFDNALDADMTGCNQPDGVNTAEFSTQYHARGADEGGNALSGRNEREDHVSESHDQSVDGAAAHASETTTNVADSARLCGSRDVSPDIKERASHDGINSSEKRQSLTEIEDSHSAEHVSSSAEDIGDMSSYINALEGSNTDVQVASIAGSDVAIAETVSATSAGGRDKMVTNSVGGKRRRKNVGMDIQSGEDAGGPTPKKARKAAGSTKAPPLFQRFTDRLDSLATSGKSAVDSHLRCQHCDAPPTDPKLSACAHIYCDKCLRKLRRLASKGEGKAQCCVCDQELEWCKKVEDDQFEEWRARYLVTGSGRR